MRCFLKWMLNTSFHASFDRNSVQHSAVEGNGKENKFLRQEIVYGWIQRMISKSLGSPAGKNKELGQSILLSVGKIELFLFYGMFLFSSECLFFYCISISYWVLFLGRWYCSASCFAWRSRKDWQRDECFQSHCFFHACTWKKFRYLNELFYYHVVPERFRKRSLLLPVWRDCHVFLISGRIRGRLRVRSSSRHICAPGLFRFAL